MRPARPSFGGSRRGGLAARPASAARRQQSPRSLKEASKLKRRRARARLAGFSLAAFNWAIRLDSATRRRTAQHPPSLLPILLLLLLLLRLLRDVASIGTVRRVLAGACSNALERATRLARRPDRLPKDGHTPPGPSLERESEVKKPRCRCRRRRVYGASGMDRAVAVACKVPKRPARDAGGQGAPTPS